MSDRLLAHRAALEAHLYQQECDLFALSETITLYDLTNTFFEGTASGNAKAKRGHSKEKRSDCPLVTLALVLDASGFPKRSEVFEGNVSEPKTLEKMLQRLALGPGAVARRWCSMPASPPRRTSPGSPSRVTAIWSSAGSATSNSMPRRPP